MSENTSKSGKLKLLSKAFHSVSDIKTQNKRLDNWFATPDGEGNYVVTRANGSKITVTPGQEIGELGPLSVDSDGNLAIAERSILVGRNIYPDISAKKTQKKGKYKITLRNQKGAKKFDVKIGESINGLGIVGEIDQYNNLTVGNGSIPVESKIKEFKMLVFDEPSDIQDNAYKALFALISDETGKDVNNGVSGAFIPQDGKKPAKFIEMSEDGPVITATFWPTRSGFVNADLRSTEDAVKANKAFKDTVKFKNQSLSLKINPKDNQEWFFANEALEKSKKDWIKHPFTVKGGESFFGLEARTYEINYG